MVHKNMIYEVLVENNIEELFIETETTDLQMEEWIECPKNPDNAKEQILPIIDITEWITTLKSLDDVTEITREEACVTNNNRGSGKDLRISIVLKLKGALKNPKKDHEFEKVFLPIKETLLKLLAQKLSYKTFIENKMQTSSGSPSADNNLFTESENAERYLEGIELDTELASTAV